MYVCMYVCMYVFQTSRREVIPKLDGKDPPGPGGGGTLRPKGLPFSGFRYILNPYPFKKGMDFTS